MPQTVFGRGAVRQVPTLLAARFGPRVLLVTGDRSFRACGAAETLSDRDGFSILARAVVTGDRPSHQEAAGIAGLIRTARPDVVLAVGGGGVIDVAKAASAVAAHDGDSRALIEGRAAVSAPLAPIVAVPTTAGSGSEATRFAVVYAGHVKHSLEHERLRPVLAIVDPDLTASVPRSVAAASGLDALVHGVESYLAVTATPQSQRLAAAAIRGVLASLPAALATGRADAREQMCRAAHLAGQAIDLTKTAAAHALSYSLTARFGVPHGHAVAMLLGPVFVHNSQVTDADVVHARGAAHVMRQIANVTRMFGVARPQEVQLVLDRLLRAGGLALRLTGLAIGHAEVDTIATDVNAERLANNPRRCTARQLAAIVSAAAAAPVDVRPAS